MNENLTGYKIQVFQSIRGDWEWEITKPREDDTLTGFTVPWQSWDTNRASGREKTFLKATAKAAEMFALLVQVEIDTQLREAFREARPTATVTT